ncbi:GFA family protein [Morganella psychrotolerans]|uniref:GFA family protein n=1 Tax=Morganella psychrotolerans TaxID=368603 RepID=A0A5M9QZ61_9GAMM|nr:GFA family protein [Morganella psychrotolerans]KAA8713471.1 GFA family protein [Morganella psychrotolerans]OBU06460.1 ribulose phosphate epimerase [Morganella psychrotolerans]
MTTEIITGGCLCGNIRYRAQHPRDPHTCSCTMCRKHTGALTALWVEFDSKNVTWDGEGGMPSLFRSSESTCRAFCPQCGSSVGAVDDAPVIALLVGGFDNPGRDYCIPEYHSFTDELPEWAAHPQDHDAD